ncbi:MAG TPA: DUF3987 domain-containing protein, partial [Methylobacter sp.]
MTNTNTNKEKAYLQLEQQVGAAKLKEAQQFKADKNKQPKNYNAVLDNEQHHCTVDYLQFVDDSHLLKQLAIDIAKATHLPEHTTFLTGLGVFSSIACRKYKVDYQDNRSLPIGLYIVAEQPSGTGKSMSTSFFQDPFNKAIKERSKEIKARLAELKDKKEKSDEEEVEIERLSKPLVPFFVTNSTPEALEETLNHTNGFFSAISTEQGL